MANLCGRACREQAAFGPNRDRFPRRFPLSGRAVHQIDPSRERAPIQVAESGVHDTGRGGPLRWNRELPRLGKRVL